MTILQLLVCVAAIAMRDRAPAEAWLTPPEAAGMLLGSIGLLTLWCEVRVRMGVRRMDRTGDARPALASLRAAAQARAFIVAAFVLGIWPGGWLDAVREGVGNGVLADEALALLPVVAGLLATYASAHRVELRFHHAMLLRHLDEGRTLHAPVSTLGHVGLVFRQQFLLVLVPVLLVGTMGEGTQAAWPWLVGRLGERRAEWMASAAEAGLLAVMILGMPAFIRLIWGAVRLGEGPMREAVLAGVRRAGGRLGRVYVWQTRGTQVNGAIVGFIPGLRYLLLTDALLESFVGRHLDAVVAHEIGHVRLPHNPWLLGAIAAALLLPGALVTALARTDMTGSWPAEVESIAGLAGVAAGVLAFGAVSRAFEREADAYAAGVLARDEGEATITDGAAVAVASALGRVAALNGVGRMRWTFRHGSIASRQRAVLALVGQPTRGHAAHRAARRLRGLTAVALVGALLLGALG